MTEKRIGDMEFQVVLISVANFNNIIVRIDKVLFKACSCRNKVKHFVH